MVGISLDGFGIFSDEDGGFEVMKPVMLVNNYWYIPAFKGVPRNILSRSSLVIIRVSDFVWNRLDWIRELVLEEASDEND